MYNSSSNRYFSIVRKWRPQFTLQQDGNFNVIIFLQMQTESANIQSRNQAENESRIQDLNKQVADYQDQIGRSQAEVIFVC